MSEGKPLRLFVAASVPEEQLAFVAERTAGLRELWPNARWTAIENQHITLKFLGSTPPDRLPDVAAACAVVAEEVEAAEITVQGLGVFPSRARARVLWAGLHDPAETLSRAAAGLDRRLEPLGFPAEKRRFTPHLTLARFREPARVGPLPDLAGAWPFRLAVFGLWRSHLSPRGARYEQLREFAFSHPS